MEPNEWRCNPRGGPHRYPCRLPSFVFARAYNNTYLTNRGQSRRSQDVAVVRCPLEQTQVAGAQTGNRKPHHLARQAALLRCQRPCRTEGTPAKATGARRMSHKLPSPASVTVQMARKRINATHSESNKPTSLSCTANTRLAAQSERDSSLSDRGDAQDTLEQDAVSTWLPGVPSRVLASSPHSSDSSMWDRVRRTFALPQERQKNKVLQRRQKQVPRQRVQMTRTTRSVPKQRPRRLSLDYR